MEKIKHPEKLAPLGEMLYLRRNKPKYPMSAQLIDCNYLIHNKIGGGKSLGLTSLGLDIQRSSVCHRHIGGRFLCALLLACMLTGCLEPIPIEDPDTRGTELEDDSTSNVNTNPTWEGWNEPDTIGFGFGPGEQEGGSDE